MNLEEKSHLELLTVEEAAQFLKLKISRLRKAIFRREVQHIKLGALVRFKKSHLQDWIDRQTVATRDLK